MGTVAQEPLGVRPVFVRSTWTQIVLAVARTTSKYVCSFARRMVPTGMTGAVDVEAGIGVVLSLATGSLFGLVCDVSGALVFVVAIAFLLLAFVVSAFLAAYCCGLVSALIVGESEWEYTSSGSPCRR